MWVAEARPLPQRPFQAGRNSWKTKEQAMLRVALVMLAMVFTADVALAQWGPPYGRSPYRQAPPQGGGFFGLFGDSDDDDDDDGPRRSMEPSFRSGGERPYIARIAPQRVAFPSSYPVGSIVIDHKGRQLFFVQSPTQALRYPISVGREGFNWSGSEKISRIADWPDWHPPEEMRERDPSLPEKMSGGIRNPLGAKALYLGNSLYRIHGTNDARSIGRAASSGCFRMLNGHVVDLASRVEVGTVVTVVRRLPPELERVVAGQLGSPEERRYGGAS
jgi:lipoprotein-anchoring transpeptidase ErfK/SrfK